MTGPTAPAGRRRASTRPAGRTAGATLEADPAVHRPPRRALELRRRPHRAGAPGAASASLASSGGNNKAQGCTGLDHPTATSSPWITWPRDGPPVRRQPTRSTARSQLLAAATAAPPLGRAGQRVLDHGLRRHLPADNLQPHSTRTGRPRSFDEITTYTSGARRTSTRSRWRLSPLRRDATRSELGYHGNVRAVSPRDELHGRGIQPPFRPSPAGRRRHADASAPSATRPFTVTFGRYARGHGREPARARQLRTGCSGYIGRDREGRPTTRPGVVTPPQPIPSSPRPPSFTIPSGRRSRSRAAPPTPTATR
jgi:hypothetical protein